MKKIENISKNVMDELGVGPKTAYEHEGAEVYIRKENKSSENKYGYAAKAVVIIKKNDNIVRVNISEEIGNDSGTIFGRVDVAGMPTRNNYSESPELGLYPYYRYTKADIPEQGDILTHAAKHLLSHDKDAEKSGIGAIFAKYVPSTLEGIQNELNDQEQQKNKSEKEVEQMAKMKAMQDKFSNFL